MVKNLLRIYLEFSTLLLLMGNTQLNFNDKKSYVVKDRDLDQRRGKKKKSISQKKRHLDPSQFFKLGLYVRRQGRPDDVSEYE